jgi:hypothetical protein
MICQKGRVQCGQCMPCIYGIFSGAHTSVGIRLPAAAVCRLSCGPKVHTEQQGWVLPTLQVSQESSAATARMSFRLPLFVFVACCGTQFVCTRLKYHKQQGMLGVGCGSGARRAHVLCVHM